MNATQAEEHLRVIRSLMEKATIYRAISAPTALVGGLLSIAVGTVMHWNSPHLAQNGTIFVAAWMAVLVLTAGANAWFLHRDAVRRGEPFISPGMRKALWSLFPSFFVGGVLTAMSGPNKFQMLPPVWMLCYGLGLLATAQFSPRGIPRLGWAFLFAGLTSFGLSAWTACGAAINGAPHLLMAATFGILHLLYAACTWMRTGACEA